MKQGMSEAFVFILVLGEGRNEWAALRHVIQVGTTGSV